MSQELEITESFSHEKGHLATLWKKLKTFKTNTDATESFPHLTQMRGLGSASWLVGFVGSILILNRFVSPIITTLAMTTLIAPIAALVLVVIGEFDFTKLTTMVTSNVGIVLTTGGTIVAALFVQNVAKMALLMRSFTSQSHKQYRTYALASMLTPVTTSALWYGATKLGYFLGAKSISLGILAIFASGAVGEALHNVDPFNATTEELASVANAMSNGLRWGLGFIILIHLYFVLKSYGLVHKTLNYLFDLAVKKVVEEQWHEKALQIVRSNLRLFIFVSVVIIGAGSAVWFFIPTEQEWVEIEAREKREAILEKKRAWRVACINKTK